MVKVASSDNLNSNFIFTMVYILSFLVMTKKLGSESSNKWGYRWVKWFGSVSKWLWNLKTLIYAIIGLLILYLRKKRSKKSDCFAVAIIS